VDLGKCEGWVMANSPRLLDPILVVLGPTEIPRFALAVVCFHKVREVVAQQGWGRVSMVVAGGLLKNPDLTQTLTERPRRHIPERFDCSLFEAEKCLARNQTKSQALSGVVGLVAGGGEGKQT
jgi:hypothetical protein